MKILLAKAERFNTKEGGDLCKFVYTGGEKSEDPENRGVDFLTVYADPEVYRGCREVPGIYEAEFRQLPGKGGRPITKLKRLEFVAEVDLSGFNAIASS